MNYYLNIYIIKKIAIYNNFIFSNLLKNANKQRTIKIIKKSNYN